MPDLTNLNQTRSTMSGSYDDTRLDKSVELNDSMTINEQSRDEYEAAIHNLGGQANDDSN